MLTMLRLGLFVLFALVVGFFTSRLSRVRARRARRWHVRSSRHGAVMVGACTTLPEVHESYLTLETPCPFCTLAQRPGYRRTQLGPFVLDVYDRAPSTEALPDVDEDDDEATPPAMLE